MDTLPLFGFDDKSPLKRCTGPCGRELPATLEYFYTDKKSGLRANCRQCTQQQRKEYLSRPEVKQHRRVQSKEYHSRPEVKSHIQHHRKEYHSRPNVRQQRQEYYARPDVIQHGKDQKKEYHARPEVRERIEGYLSLPDIQAQRREWRKEYRTRPGVKEQDRIHSSTRLARKKSIPGTYTREQIEQKLKAQKYRCYYAACGYAKFVKKDGKYVYHIEHTFPVSRVAGTDIPANSIDYLVLACPHCNDSKSDKFPWEWPNGGRLL